jgi:hypothetical protein
MPRLAFLSFLLPCLLTAEVIETELLIVGGNESACAAAIQASRLGVKHIVLVNDIGWLGGQFSAEGVGCLDEWIVVGGKRTNFPRSGLFLEMVRLIRAHNSATYGKASPGNAFCGTETIEPKAAAEIFETWLAAEAPQVRILRGWEPVKVSVKDGAVTGVKFHRTDRSDASDMTVNATLTLDSSDWGDVIRLSGAKYGAGPDLKSRFGEDSAPAAFDEAGAQEMNPISYCVVLRETLGQDATVPRPASYDARSFASLDRIPPWVDSDMSAGIYSPSGNSPYTHRRLVDRWHNGFAPGTEATFINYPVQDYPLCQLPQRVIDALEQTEAGASRKNIVDLTPAQRRLIFEDAKQHALGVLHHLQTAAHERVGDFPQSFRYMKLTDEFGTHDRLPPKPYIREGLRLEALSMLKEQDIRAATREPKWARVMPEDAVLAFQFNIDFHPTRRKFLTEDRNGPWQFIHTKERGWHTDTDRAVFPVRGLVPVEMNGLLGCGKNIGVSSVVQSALRLHGQMMLVGQASATLAWMSLREGVRPRQIATDMAKVRELQLQLARGKGGPGVLLWPWQDLAPDDPHFEAVNMLSVLGIWQPDPGVVFFHPDHVITQNQLATFLGRLNGSEFTSASDAPATWSILHDWLTRLKLPVTNGLVDGKDHGLTRADYPLTRAEAAMHLWRAWQLSRHAGRP